MELEKGISVFGDRLEGFMGFEESELIDCDRLFIF